MHTPINTVHKPLLITPEQIFELWQPIKTYVYKHCKYHYSTNSNRQDVLTIFTFVINKTAVIYICTIRIFQIIMQFAIIIWAQIADKHPISKIIAENAIKVWEQKKYSILSD